MKKHILSILLAIAVTVLSVTPACAMVQGVPPDVGVGTGGALDNHGGEGNASGGSQIFLVTSRAEYALVIVKDSDGNPVQGATVKIVAINTAGEVSTATEVTDSKGEATVPAEWGSSYYFYAYQSGYYQISPSVDPPAQSTVPTENPHSVNIVLKKYPAGTTDQTKEITVKDKEGSAGITVANAQVELTYTVSGVTVTERYFTNQYGKVTVNIPAGATSFRYTLSKSGFQDSTGTFTTANSETLYFDVQETTLSFHVKSSAAGNPSISGASVVVTLNGTQVGSGVTDSSGNITVNITNFDATKTYRYTVTKNGYTGRTGTVTPNTATQPVQVTLTATTSGGSDSSDVSSVTYTIKVVASSSSKALGAVKIVIVGSQSGTKTVYTGSDGTVRIDLIPGESFTYTMTKDGYVTVFGSDITNSVNSSKRIGMIATPTKPTTPANPEDNTEKDPEINDNEIIIVGPDGQADTSDDIKVIPDKDNEGKNNAVVDDDGNVTLPDGGDLIIPIIPGKGEIGVNVPKNTIVRKDGTLVLPEGNEKTNITLPGPNEKLGDSDDVTVIPNLDENGHNNAIIHPEGSVELPNGGVYLTNGGSVYINGQRVEVMAGTTVLCDGTILYPTISDDVTDGNGEISFQDCERHPRITWEIIPMLWMVGRFLFQRKRFQELD